MKKQLNPITFSNIVGYEKEKEELKEIKNFILNPKQYEEIGARVPKGILLVGPSGNGKTLMAKALFSELNIPVYSIGDEVDEDERVLSIKSVFKEARKNSPSIIFIDEIDKLDKFKDDIIDLSNTKSPVIRELLTQMDGFETNSGIIVVATANTSSELEKSLLRSGRFDRTIFITLPNKRERKELLEFYSKNKKISENICFDKLAVRTSGLSCADIDNILNEAAILSMKEDEKAITMSILEKAIDRVMFGSIENNLSEETRKIIATHEIGHTVVALALGHKDRISKVSIVSRGDTGGYTSFNSSDEYQKVLYLNHNDLLEDIMISYGGMCAEKIFLKKVSLGCENDLREIGYSAELIIKKTGMCGIKKTICTNGTFGDGVSERKKYILDKTKEKLLYNAYNKTMKIIKKNKVLFTKLYDYIMESNVLFKCDIEEILKEMKKGEN